MMKVLKRCVTFVFEILNSWKKINIIYLQSDTINPFDDSNGEILNGLLDASALLDQTDDPQLELTDLQRQVVYLQVFARYIFSLLPFYMRYSNKHIQSFGK